VTITKGSIFLEIILWLCFILPGLIYSIWRHISRHEACASCKQTTLIPVTSPMGQKFIQENLGGEAALPKGGAYAAGAALGKLLKR
jgi:hypothetical protein